VGVRSDWRKLTKLTAGSKCRMKLSKISGNPPQMETVPGFVTIKDSYHQSLVKEKLKHKRIIKMKYKPDSALFENFISYQSIPRKYLEVLWDHLFKAVLRIRIRKDPHHLAGSDSGSGIFDAGSGS
jgi:hypothetical protein